MPERIPRNPDYIEIGGDDQLIFDYDRNTIEYRPKNGSAVIFLVREEDNKTVEQWYSETNNNLANVENILRELFPMHNFSEEYIEA